MNNVIFMAVLDSTSQEALKKFAIHDNIYCHHVTLAFQPSDEMFTHFRALVGKAYSGKVSWIIQDRNAQAARVEGNIRSLNKNPHVTISCAADIKPVYSNQLLNLPATEVLEMPLLHPLMISGTVTIGNL